MRIFTFFYLLFNFLSVQLFSQTGPGGVGNSSNNRLWLDANRQSAINGATVQTWTDFSGNGYSASQAISTRRPVFSTNAINGKAALTFNGTKWMDAPSNSALNTNNLSWFIVAKINNLTQTHTFVRANYASGAAANSNVMWGSFLWLTSGKFHSHAATSTGSVPGVGYNANTSYNIHSSIWNGDNAELEAFINGSTQGIRPGVDANPTNHNLIRIGANSANVTNFLNGSISEIILFNESLNTSERKIIENYISSKYALPVSNDLYSFDAPGGHSFDVAGIGQEVDGNNTDAQGTGIVRINNPSALSDGDYLLFGHNNLSLASTNSTDVPEAGVDTRLNRTWRVSETGEVGTMDISFNLTGTTFSDPSTLQLWIDNDGIFSNTTLHSGGRSYDSGTNTLTFTNVSFTNGDFFTIGSGSIVTIADGLWSNPATWSCNCVPTTLDNARIAAGHDVTIDAAAGINNLTISPTGTLTISNASTFTVIGNWSNTGTFSGGATGTVLMNLAGVQSLNGTGPFTFFNLNLSTSGTKTISAQDLIVNGELSINGTAVLDLNSNNLLLGGNLSNNADTDILNQGDVTFTGTGTQIITRPSTETFSSLIHTGSGTILLGQGIEVTGDFTNSAGTFDVSSSNFPVTINGNFTNDATINFRAGTFNFPSATTQTLAGTTHTEFFDVIFSGGTKSITYAGGLDSDNDMTINNPAVIDLNGLDVHIFRHLTSTTPNAFINYGSNTFVFNGTTDQNISLTGTQNFRNISCDNPTSVSFTSGNFHIEESIAVKFNGTLNTNGLVTLLSTASVTAHLDELQGTAIVNGNITVQRFLSSRDSGYVDLSSPVQNSTVADWDNELFIYGINGPDGGTVGQATSMYTYSEAAWDYIPVSSPATALTPGMGFYLYLTQMEDDSASLFGGAVMNTIGVPNQGTQDLSGLVTYVNDGYNSVGNPFASPIRWGDVLSASSNISGTYLYYSDVARNFVNINDPNSLIPSTHGFTVIALNSSASLIIPESAKEPDGNSIFNRTAPAYSGIELDFTNDQNPYYHTLQVNLDMTASFAKDDQDVIFKKSPEKRAPNLTAISADGKFLSTCAIPNEDVIIIPLKSYSGVAGNYTITAKGLSNYPEYSCVSLTDKKLGKTIDLNSDNSYTFAAGIEDVADRFELRLSKNGNCNETISIASTLDAAVSKENGLLIAVGGDLMDETAVVTVYNALGQRVMEENTLVKDQKLVLNVPQNNAVYIVNIKTASGKMITERVIF